MKDPVILNLTVAQRRDLLAGLYAEGCTLGRRTLVQALARLDDLVHNDYGVTGMTVELDDHRLIYWISQVDERSCLVNSIPHFLSYVKRACAAQHADRMAALEADTPF